MLVDCQHRGIRTPPLLPIAVCDATKVVCCEEPHWLLSSASGTVSRTVVRLIAIARTVLSDLRSDLAYAPHHNLVLVTADDSDLVDKIVDSRNTRICSVVATETVVGLALAHLLGNALLRQDLLVPSSMDWSVRTSSSSCVAQRILEHLLGRTVSSGLRFLALRTTRTHPAHWRRHCTRCTIFHCTRRCR